MTQGTTPTTDAAARGRGRAYLGIDVGTSGTKVALVAASGEQLAIAEAEHPMVATEPGRAEADPAEWMAAVVSAVRRLGPSIGGVDVRGVGVTGQMHGAIACDDAGRPLRPAILWLDNRADPELSRWHKLPRGLLDRLANPLVSGMTGPTVTWLARHEPDVIARTAAVVHAKDVVRHALIDGRPGRSASPVTDRSDASATLLWDVAADTWCTEVCDAVGVTRSVLPEVHASDMPAGTTGLLAEWTGRDVPVVIGAGDTPAAMFALDVAGLQVNLGTGAQLVLPRATPDRTGLHPSVHLYADADQGWYAMAALRNGGSALEVAARALGLTVPDLLATAETGRPGAAVFVPFATGERGGVASPDARAGWVGLDDHATTPDLARAAVEGVLFAIRRAAELLGDHAHPADEVVLSGGVWRSRLPVQLAADVLRQPVRRSGLRSASATGAARLAARAFGDELRPAGRTSPPIDPGPERGLDGAYLRWRSAVHDPVSPSSETPGGDTRGRTPGATTPRSGVARPAR